MNYKGFDINTSTTPRPWGAREQQNDQDTIDTLVTGTLQGEKQAIGGHQHTQMVRITSDQDGQGNLIIYPSVTADTSNLTLLPPCPNSLEPHPINIAATSNPNSVISINTSSADALSISSKSINITTVGGNLTVNGNAPLNHVLLGNGTGYVDAALPASGIGGSGTTNYIPVFTDATTITASGLQVFNSGPNTYISEPSAGLWLQGANITLATNSSTEATLIILAPQDSNEAAHVINIGADSNGHVTIATQGGSDKLYIQSNSSGDSLTIANLGGISSLNYNGSVVSLTCTQFVIGTLPTSSAGLPSGCLWNSSGTLKVA